MKYTFLIFAFFAALLTGCANPSACLSGCASTVGATPAKLTHEEQDRIRNKTLVKVQEWTVHTGDIFPAEVKNNLLESGAPKLSAKNYPRGVFVCAQSNQVCAPIISAYIGNQLNRRYGFTITQNPAEADGLFYFDAWHFSGTYEYDETMKLEIGLKEEGVKPGDDLSRVTFHKVIQIIAPQRWNDTQVVTSNLVVVDPAKAVPFEGNGLAKRGAGTLWYRHGDLTPRYSVNGIYHGGIHPHAAFIPMYFEGLNELLNLTFEPLGKN